MKQYEEILKQVLKKISYELLQADEKGPESFATAKHRLKADSLIAVKNKSIALFKRGNAIEALLILDEALS